MTVEPRKRETRSRLPRLLLIVLLVVSASLTLLASASHHRAPGSTSSAPTAAPTVGDALGAAIAPVTPLATALATIPAERDDALALLACVCVLLVLAAAGMRRRIETTSRAAERVRAPSAMTTGFAHAPSGRMTLSLLSVARV